MPTACLTIPSASPPSSGATPLSARNDREAVERAASIIRKYATGSVAIGGGNAVRVDLSRVPWKCDARERARRLAQLASSWTGRNVTVEVESGRRNAPAGHFAVELTARPGEPPAVFRERIARAGDRLAAMVEAQGLGLDRWLFQLQREGGHTTMPLPSRAFDDGVASLSRRLPDTALANITSIRLEARTRRLPHVAVPGTRAPEPVRFPGRPERLPLVS